MAQSFDDLMDMPLIQFDAYVGFSGQLTRGLKVLPSGQELVYVVGAHLAFLQINEQQNREAKNATKPLTRKVGGGHVEARPRAFGGTTTKPNSCTVMTNQVKAPLFERPDQLQIPQQEDTNIVVPGSMIRPTLIAGHQDQISAMDLSKSGRIIVTGCLGATGQPPEIGVWDVETKQLLNLQNQHKSSVTDISISPEETFFATLGEDSTVVFYPLNDDYEFPVYKPLAGRTFQVPKPLTCIKIISETCCVVAGDDYLNFITVNLRARTLSDIPVRLPLRRKINCMELVDGYLYAGTEQGDVIKIEPERMVGLQSCPAKKPFPGAVTSIASNDQGNILVSTTASQVFMIRTDTMIPVSTNDLPTDTGAGSSTSANSNMTINTAVLSAVQQDMMNKDEASSHRAIRMLNCVPNGVSCLAGAVSGAGQYIYALGLNAICRINKSSLEVRLLQTAPPAANAPFGVSCVAAPHDTNRVFVSCCGQFVSVWSARTGIELIRIQVPSCRAVCCLVTPDGQQIISGWSDGAIRSHAPQSGKGLWTIQSCHSGSVDAIAQSCDGAFIISGGQDAKICLWDVSTRKLLQVCAGHRGPISCINCGLQVDGDQEVVSGCKAGFVQCFRLNVTPTMPPTASLTAIWSSRAEGDVRGIAHLQDGSQVLAIGSGGLVWFQCGKSGGAILRALPLPAGGSAVAIEEHGEVCKVVLGLTDGHTYIMDWDSGRIEKQLKVHSDSIKSVCISQGSAFVSSSDGGIVLFQVWE